MVAESQRKSALEKMRENPRLTGDSWIYFKSFLDGKQPDTQSAYLNYFIQFLEWADTDSESLFHEHLENDRESRREGGNIRARNLIPMKVKTFQTHLIDSGLKSGSALIVYRAVLGFFKVNSLDFSGNGDRLKQDPEDKTEIPTITKNDLKSVLNATGSLKLQAMIYFLRDSGMRVSDLVRVKVGDIQPILDDPTLEFHTWTFRQKKTKRKADPVIGVQSIDLIRKWIKYRTENLGISANPNDPLFCLTRERPEYVTKTGRFVKAQHNGDPMGSSSVGVAFGQLVNKVGIQPNTEGKKPSVHSLRKYYKTNLEASNVPESWINKMTGRAGSGTGGVYSKPNPEQLIEAYQNGYWNLTFDSDTKSLNTKIEEMKRDNVAYMGSAMELERENVELKARISRLENGTKEESLREMILKMKAEGLI